MSYLQGGYGDVLGGATPACESEMVSDVVRAWNLADDTTTDTERRDADVDIVRQMERQRHRERYGFEDDGDTDQVVLPSRTCPSAYGKDEQGNMAGPFERVSKEEARRIDKSDPKWARYNRVMVEKNGKTQRVSLTTADGDHCIRFRPKASKKDWGVVVGEIERLAQHMTRDVRRPMEEGLKDSVRMWNQETKRQLRDYENVELVRKYGEDASFIPDDSVGCDPTGERPPQDWQDRFGTPAAPKNPNIVPTAYEKALNKWYRPAIAELGDKPRCLPDQYVGRGGKTLTDFYPMTYHSLDTMPVDSLPSDDQIPTFKMPRMKMYQRALKCAQALDENSCEVDESNNHDAPLGGTLDAASACVYKGRGKPDGMCVPTEVATANQTPSRILGDDPLNQWYAEMYKRERRNLNKDPWIKSATRGNRRSDLYPDGPAAAQRVILRPDSASGPVGMARSAARAAEEYYNDSDSWDDSDSATLSTMSTE
jgi:hypothetical protein